MIILLTGPPTAGKSSFAARFVLAHPQFRYCPIDEYRIEYDNELRAWTELTKDILERRYTVMESCGTSWRLRKLLNIPTIRKRPLITIAFTAEKDILFSRLRERQKRPLPPPFRPEDEHLAIEHLLEHFEDEIVTGVDYTIDTSNKDQEEVYNVVNSVILSKTLQNKQLERKIKKTPDSRGEESFQLKRVKQL